MPKKPNTWWETFLLRFRLKRFHPVPVVCSFCGKPLQETRLEALEGSHRFYACSELCRLRIDLHRLDSPRLERLDWKLL